MTEPIQCRPCRKSLWVYKTGHMYVLYGMFWFLREQERPCLRLPPLRLADHDELREREKEKERERERERKKERETERESMKRERPPERENKERNTDRERETYSGQTESHRERDKRRMWI